jgi:hypothetical protein
MLYRKYIVSFISLLAITACANTPTDNNSYIQQPRPYLPVEINVLSDVRGALPDYPVNSDASHYRAYLQASNNDRYRISVGNNTNQRIGVVIAVDGRNIISGQKSYLQNTERMYIINPHSSEEYEGWRSGQNQLNRFYFTEAADSYAAAWGDTSAMGVIAVAVYAEIPPPEIYAPMTDMMRDRAAAESKSVPKQAAPGTGYGETRYSPSIPVNFQPQPEPFEKVFLKYEWRETLCKKGIRAACDVGAMPKPDENRFWPNNDGFAPPPPRRRY